MTNEQEGVRFVKFPPDRSLGILQVRDWGISGGWQWFHEAQGTVAIPFGKEVRLRVKPDAVSDLSPLAELELDDIQWLDLSKTPVADPQLRHIGNLTLLRRLDLRQTPVGDATLEAISTLSSLKELRLNGTRVSDQGLSFLSKLPRLENLWLYDTMITDAAVQHLKKMQTLEVLQLPGQISHEAQNELKQALHACYINIQR